MYQKQHYELLAAEIQDMVTRDQEMRKSGTWNTDIDIQNTKRAKEIIEEIGYPTISKVGKKPSHEFWLLIQHADKDADFQKECLALMRSLAKEEVIQSDIAYLDDRVRVAEGRPTLYGTQFYENPETKVFEVRPIEDRENLDKRRTEVGLNPFAEYEENMMKMRREYEERKKENKLNN